MNHYNIINETLDFYANEGVNPIDFLQYLNNAEDNFKFIFNKVKSKCTVKNLEVDENLLLDDLKEMIRDRIAFINDINKNPNI